MTGVADLDRRRRLNDATTRLATVQSLDELVQVLRNHARGVSGGDGIAVIRREGPVVHYVAEDAIGPLWTGERFIARNCISGLAMIEKRAILISDIYADNRVPQLAYAATFVRSMAMFPIGKGDPQMSVGAYWKTTGEIAAETVSLMTGLARAATQVYERVAPRDTRPTRPNLGRA